MKKWTNAPRWRAAGTAALLLVAGGALGVVADRLWLSPPPAEATPLTAEAMATRLELSASEAAHVRSLLDSLHAEILTVVRQSPDSLGTAVRNAHQRIEAALPPEDRSAFRAWIREHHEQMMGRMQRDVPHGSMHRGGSMGFERMRRVRP